MLSSFKHKGFILAHVTRLSQPLLIVPVTLPESLQTLLVPVPEGKKDLWQVLHW